MTHPAAADGQNAGARNGAAFDRRPRAMSRHGKGSQLLGAISAALRKACQLDINVAAMLIPFIACWRWCRLSRSALRKLAFRSPFDRGAPQSLEPILGWIFFSQSTGMIGNPLRRRRLNNRHLLGTRMSINEVVAFAKLGQLKTARSTRSFTIATFSRSAAFAN